MEYYINIEKPIYPDENLSDKDNIVAMREKNSAIWKQIYEDFYKIPLEYTTIKHETQEEENK